MTLQVGDVDLMKEIAELWFELVKTQNLLETVLKNSLNAEVPIKPPSATDLKLCEDKAFTAVRNRFPSLNIRRR